MPLDRRNVDTDAIIPQEHCRTVTRQGFGPFLFRRWRDEQPDFVLNDARHAGATVLLARENFGCGSSREHAVWALRDAGFRAVVATSFGDIFRQNCALNGVAALRVDERDAQRLFDMAAVQKVSVEIDVLGGRLTPMVGTSAHPTVGFVLGEREKMLLTRDIDWIGATLAQRDRIAAFEAERLARQPWLDRMLDKER